MLKKIVWSISALVTITLILCIAGVIYKVSHTPALYPEQLSSDQKVTDYIKNYLKQNYANSTETIHFVPTGIYVEALWFVSPSSVHISGYLWQKYPPSFPKNYFRGFILPRTTKLNVTQVYNTKEGNVQVLGWHFDGDFDQTFDYSKYPLDYKVVRLRIWPRDLDKSIILTPNLSSYASTRSSAVFGLDPRIVLQGYTFADTFFSYVELNYDTNFGLQYDILSAEFPELVFNIPLKRNILGAFIINLLPLSIVVLFSFSLLHIMTDNERNRQRYGFNLAVLANVYPTMLFVVVLSHIHLREAIMSDNVFYLEVIYFVVYIGLLYITAVGFLVMQVHEKHKLGFIFYDDCLLLKAMYLPFVFGLILLVTIVMLL